MTVGLLALAGCEQGGEWLEVARVASPDAAVDAVILELATDATVSRTFAVFVVPHDGDTEPGTMVLFADRTDAPRADWLGQQRLSLTCAGARVWSFQNFAEVRTVADGRRNVGIALACGQSGHPDD